MLSPMPVTERQTRARLSREESRARIVSATAELVRTRSFVQLSVDEIMGVAGLGRTIFYRHFDDLADLLTRVGRAAIDELYAAQRALAEARPAEDPDAIAQAMQTAAAVYERHGPVLRAVAEAAAGDPAIASDYETMRRLFDDLVVGALRDACETPPESLQQTARALNLLNESYLLDAYGREPKVPTDVAARTLSQIWESVVGARPAP
jgi:AcrR family transcriptional regulator